MGTLDYNNLHNLQDRVLDVVFSLDNTFYLAGGTCLNRFYQQKRYSCHLDLFCHDTPLSRNDIKALHHELKNNHSVETVVDSRDFVRYMVDSLLQVDLVNDRVKQIHRPVITDQGYRIDTVENILSNKLTAVMGRDNPKDIFDIYLICSYYSFKWEQILSDAREKLVFQKEDLVMRLKTFPVSLLGNLQVSDSAFLDGFEEQFAIIIDEIIDECFHESRVNKDGER